MIMTSKELTLEELRYCSQPLIKEAILGKLRWGNELKDFMLPSYCLRDYCVNAERLRPVLNDIMVNQMVNEYRILDEVTPENRYGIYYNAPYGKLCDSDKVYYTTHDIITIVVNVTVDNHMTFPRDLYPDEECIGCSYYFEIHYASGVIEHNEFCIEHSVLRTICQSIGFTIGETDIELGEVEYLVAGSRDIELAE